MACIDSSLQPFFTTQVEFFCVEFHKIAYIILAKRACLLRVNIPTSILSHVDERNYKFQLFSKFCSTLQHCCKFWNHVVFARFHIY